MIVKWYNSLFDLGDDWFVKAFSTAAVVGSILLALEAIYLILR